MHAHRLALGACLAAIILTLAPAQDALACSFAGPTEFVVDSTATPSDTLAAPTLKILSIDRGDDQGTSCSDLGTITLKVEPKAADVGYAFKVVGGKAPGNLLGSLGQGTWQSPEADGSFTLIWGEEAQQEQDPFSFDLEVTPVDRSGARGAASVITISHGGVEGGLCTFTGASRHVPAPACVLIFGAMMLWGWRRRVA